MKLWCSTCIARAKAAGMTNDDLLFYIGGTAVDAEKVYAGHGRRDIKIAVTVTEHGARCADDL